MDSETKIWLILSFFLLVASYMQHCVYGKPEVPCFFIFGDSLSDVGNNNYLQTTSKANYEPYGVDFPKGPTGRYSNDRTGANIISELMGFPNYIPPVLNTSGHDIMRGVNYASGGSGILEETGSHFGQHMSFGEQVANHRGIVSQIASIYIGLNKRGSFELAKRYLSKCLYYVNFGTNDYEVNYFLPNSNTSDIYTPEEYAQILIDQYSLYLKQLRDVGARKFVLNGLSPLGCTPNSILNGSCNERQNAAANIFNDRLKDLVARSDFPKLFNDSKSIFVNISAIFPTPTSGSGFANTTAPCCPTDEKGFCIPDQTPCRNRNDYVYWDGIHSSDVVNQLIAINAYNGSNPNYTFPMDIKTLIQLG
ncbi:hypothetical protein VNO77_34095 [Canavalia gladiata]|uniref:Uncharacterized protein n=1 Tax=Canavalia gladiata TaxID=3824 RepID=A0AAN9PZI3_CANGL